MSDVSGRRAARLVAPRWLDARLLLGIVLVLASVVIGARVFASADHFTELYVAAHPLVPGEHLTDADFSVGEVRLDGEAGSYIGAATAPPVGYVVQRYVGAGEFIPSKALAPTAKTPDDRLVTLPVEPGHLPPDVGPGSAIDVYVTTKSAVGGASPVRLVASDLAVESRSGGGDDLSDGSVLSLVVDVPQAEVTAMVQAAEAGAIDIVLLPASGDQQ